MEEETKELLRNKLGAAGVGKEDIDLIVNKFESAECCTVYVLHNHMTRQKFWRVMDLPLDEAVVSLFHELVEDLNIAATLLICKISEEEGTFQVPVAGLNACATDLRLGVRKL